MDWRSLHQRLLLLGRQIERTWRHWSQELHPRWRNLQQRARDGLRRLELLGRSVWQSLELAWRQARTQQQRLWQDLRGRLPHEATSWWRGPEPPPAARRLVDGWHTAECWVAVIAFGFIASIMVLDVFGREFVGPFLRFLGFDPGATGIFFSQKLSIFALVIGSFAGIGIATATGAHIVPTFASGWVPAEWQRAYDRAVDLLTGVFLVGVAWFGFKFVGSSFRTDLRAPVIDWAVWPIQLAIPLGFLSAAGRYFLYAAWPALRPIPPEFQE